MMLLVMRLVRARGLDRIVITPIIVAGIAATIAAIASAATMALISLSSAPNDVYLAESVADFAIPVAFLIAMVQRLLLIRNVAELTAQASLDGDIGALRHALRNSLHDPTLELLDTSDPSLPALDARSAGRLVSYIRQGQGAPIAVVIADPGLARYRGLFDAAMRASGLALQNAQLQAQAAREKLEQVKVSRARIIEAGLAERRRLERDLHDGVQQHLLSITARLTAAMIRTTDPAATDAFGQARDGPRRSWPSSVTSRTGFTRRRSLKAGWPSRLRRQRGGSRCRFASPGPGRRLGLAVEATLYFVACEALANVVKHAKADSALVTVEAGESWLEMEIADDGPAALRPPVARAVAWPTSPTASVPSTGKSPSTARPVRAPASKCESRAGSDRRGLGLVPQQPRAAPQLPWRRGRRRGALRRGVARGHQARPARCGYPRHPDAAIVYRRGHPHRARASRPAP